MEEKLNNDPEEFELQQIATKKVVKLKSFYIHMFVYLGAVVVYVLKKYFGISFHFFPFDFINGFVMLIWTVFFLVSAIDIFASFKIFGEEWEERKVKSILEKKVKKQKWE